jgi:hypothetical protein
MRTTLILVIGLVAGLLAGCGSSMLKPTGRVVKGGAPFLPKDGEFIIVTFCPEPTGGKATNTELYVCEVDRTKAKFTVAGKDGRGLPPGKYRVAVQLEKHHSDLLKGQFAMDKSPFVFDVDGNTKEIVLDLDNPPKG